MSGEWFGESFGEWCLLYYCLDQGRRDNMEKLYHLWGRYGTKRNMRILYIVASLVALAVASAAPGGGGGASGGTGIESFVKFMH